MREIREPAACLMKEASGIFGGRGHAELTDIDGVDGSEVGAAAFAGLAGERTALLSGKAFAGQEASQKRVGTSRINLRHVIDEEPGLRGVVRRILVDSEETDHAVDQVVECGTEVGSLVAITAPTVEAEAVVFVFLEGRRVEDAENIFSDLDGFDVVAIFSGGAPVEGVDVLQDSE